MDDIVLTFEETGSFVWKKVMAKIEERQASLLAALQEDLPHDHTQKIRGALRELNILAGIAYKADDDLPQ